MLVTGLDRRGWQVELTYRYECYRSVVYTKWCTRSVKCIANSCLGRHNRPVSTSRSLASLVYLNKVERGLFGSPERKTSSQVPCRDPSSANAEGQLARTRQKTTRAPSRRRCAATRLRSRVRRGLDRCDSYSILAREVLIAALPLHNHSRLPKTLDTGRNHHAVTGGRGRRGTRG